MKFFQKKRAEIQIVVYEDGKIENCVTGRAWEVASALTSVLCALCIENQVDGVSRGELRERIMAQVGEIFDDVWRVKNLRGELE